jgi:hypothetical protein
VLRLARRILFPDPPRKFPYARAWNMSVRTAHIAVTGILFGGHVFEIPAAQLLVWLYATILTGAALVFLEAYSHSRWLYQGRGVAVMAKLLLLCLIPWLWDYRVPILAVVVVIASVGSHMPARFRYYSFVHGRVVEEPRKSPPT